MSKREKLPRKKTEDGNKTERRKTSCQTWIAKIAKRNYQEQKESSRIVEEKTELSTIANETELPTCQIVKMNYQIINHWESAIAEEQT